MKLICILFFCMAASMVMAQTESANVIPTLAAVRIDDGSVTTLHLSPGYASSVRLPEEISSVIVGDPASFKAEHSESEPRLVFFKPVTAKPRESNALITTKSGQEISLHLLSAGEGRTGAPVDFLVDYRRPHSVLVSSDATSFLVLPTHPVFLAPTSSSAQSEKLSAPAQALERQRAVSYPIWEGKDVLAAVGESSQREQQTMIAFSVLNNSKHAIELLPPQIELKETGKGNKRKTVKAEPIVVSEYHMTGRRLAAGQRVDGVVVFERPSFKESGERLQLRLAEAEQVNHPILLSVPFTADGEMR
jgi:hypothetical protein